MEEFRKKNLTDCPEIFPNHPPHWKAEGKKISGRVSYQNVTKKSIPSKSMGLGQTEHNYSLNWQLDGLDGAFKDFARHFKH